MTLEGFTDASSILRSGVYALVAKGVVIYVGKSKSMYSRIYTHRHFARKSAKGQAIPSWLPVRGFVFDEVWVRPCAAHELDTLEWEMINRYKPRYNESLKNSLKVSTPISLKINGAVIELNSRIAQPVLRRL